MYIMFLGKKLRKVLEFFLNEDSWEINEILKRKIVAES